MNKVRPNIGYSERQIKKLSFWRKEGSREEFIFETEEKVEFDPTYYTKVEFYLIFLTDHGTSVLFF
jgi:hypothetical protein